MIRALFLLLAASMRMSMQAALYLARLLIIVAWILFEALVLFRLVPTAGHVLNQWLGAAAVTFVWVTDFVLAPIVGLRHLSLELTRLWKVAADPFKKRRAAVDAGIDQLGDGFEGPPKS